jgi:GNAT superfamily N-acetyltransferase
MNWYKTSQAGKKPWEMTQEEFMDFHYTGFIASDTYDSYKQPEGMDWMTKENHPKFHSKKTFGDYEIEFHQEDRDLQYVQYDPDAEWEFEHLRDENGQLIYMTDEQKLEKGLPLKDTSIVAFDGEKAVGFTSNEFGADGVWVTEPYQSLGIGTYLLSELRKQFSDVEGRKIGQMTESGMAMAKAYHRQEVFRAIDDGLLTSEHPKWAEITADYPGMVSKDVR